ncbi:zinc finger protein RTS2 [Apiospora rasikravindrae]|uniref:Zinc finger protein RTS2 n=1 Tax=Apiospora rasikravindrae TaxID=990691 RepID=A0ABR1RRK4_9PEZI
MGKAEVGSAKHLSNQMRRKGLQRLRWYCQVCEKQCFDDNGFKMHTQSESHVRQMLVVGEDSKKFINDYSRQFQRDFLQLLRTSHGEKAVQINQFYQSYIANKEHVHMNATKWPSLTEFAKHLGREGICRVEEKEDGKGIFVAWIDDSPEAMRRREAIKKKEMQDKGDEEREQRMIKEQIKRANKEAAARGGVDAEAAAADEPAEGRVLKRDEGEKIKLSFGAKSATPAESAKEPSPEKDSSGSSAEISKPTEADPAEPNTEKKSTPEVPAPATSAAGAPVSLKMAAKPQPKNVFAAAKKNALSGGSKKPSPFQQPKKMSEAERIMKEEMEKNNKKRPGSGFGGFAFNKKQRTD